MSHKISVESVGEADADDVLIALIDTLFLRSSMRRWSYFGTGLLFSISLSLAFWLDGSFLTAALFSATALAFVVCRIIGLSRERPAAQIERVDEFHVRF